MGRLRIYRNIVVVIAIVAVMGMGIIRESAWADVSYEIPKMNVVADVEKDGSMHVVEYIEYSFDGEAHGIYRSILTQGSDGIDILKVSTVDGSDETELPRSDSGQDGTYQIIQDDERVTAKIFRNTTDAIRVFKIEYNVRSAAKRYMDIGELYWKFMGDETDVEIGEFEAVVNIPGEGFNQGDIRAWGHGSIEGAVDVYADHAVFTVENLSPNTMVEGRLLFPKEYLQSADEISIEREQAVLDEESEWAQKANDIRTRARFLVLATFIVSAVQIIFAIYLYFRYDREYKPEFDGDYYRELPGDYSPAEMSFLMNFGSVSMEDVTATVMDLVRRRQLVLESVTYEQGRFLIGSKDVESIRIARAEGFSKSELRKHEAALIDWLIEDMGNGKEVILKKLERSIKGDESAAKKYSKGYESFADAVGQEAEKHGFFEKGMSSARVGAIIFGILGVIAGFILIFSIYAAGTGAILIATSIILAVYSAIIKKRTRYGANQFGMWKAFKKFLKHFSQIDKAGLPSVVVWEHYLVYAISLGVAKEAIKQLKVVYPPDDFEDSRLTYLGYSYSTGMAHALAFESVTEGISSTMTSAFSAAKSELSSSEGSGGGFSSGGGGGGGGGGTGAF